MTVKPVDSWVLPMSVNGIKTHALIDTGAACCLLSKAIYDQMSTSLHPLKTRSHSMYAVGGQTVPTEGDLVCDVAVNGRHYPIDMVVSSENETVGCILGMDFLLDHDCDLAVKTGHLFLGNMKVKLRKESTTNVIARIRLEDDVTLPPRTELSVTGKAEAMSKRIPTFYSCVEPSPSMKRRARNHVLTGYNYSRATDEHRRRYTSP